MYDFVPASNFVNLPKQLQSAAVASGMIPSNDIFISVSESNSKIILFYGSYGSGKSVFIADLLITKCLTDKYFRCFYGRAVYRTVRESIFQTIVDRIKERYLNDKFTFSESDNSSMVIRCKENDNYFVPFGTDDPDKIKSIKDPSHIFIDELDQISQKDFSVLYSRLRTTKTNTQLFGAFNTTKVRPQHWIKESFFGPESDKFDIQKIFCNYTDNYFIDQKEYEKTLWLSAGNDPQRFNEIAKGAWGVARKGIIYPQYYEYENEPAEIRHVYGLDFGFVHPTALIDVGKIPDAIYCKELIYESGLTPQAIINKMKVLNLGRNPIYCDHSRPELIKMLYRAGFNVKNANKDILLGISHVKSKKIYIHKFSLNLKNEIDNYQWQTDKNELQLDKPLKVNDDGMDAIRYADYSDEMEIKRKFGDATY